MTIYLIISLQKYCLYTVYIRFWPTRYMAHVLCSDHACLQNSWSLRCFAGFLRCFTAWLLRCFTAMLCRFSGSGPRFVLRPCMPSKQLTPAMLCRFSGSWDYSVRIWSRSDQAAGDASPNKIRAWLCCSVLTYNDWWVEPRLIRWYTGLFSSIFWEQGFDKVRESSRTLKVFEQFDVQFRKWKILLVSMVSLVQNMLVLSYMCVYVYIINNECRNNQNVWRPSKALSCISGCNFGPKSSILKSSTDF